MKFKICTECHCAVMEPHSELLFWFKCPICGFSEFELKLLSERNKKIAKKNKYASRHDMIDERVRKP